MLETCVYSHMQQLNRLKDEVCMKLGCDTRVDLCHYSDPLKV